MGESSHTSRFIFSAHVVCFRSQAAGEIHFSQRLVLPYSNPERRGARQGGMAFLFSLLGSIFCKSSKIMSEFLVHRRN